MRVPIATQGLGEPPGPHPVRSSSSGDPSRRQRRRRVRSAGEVWREGVALHRTRLGRPRSVRVSRSARLRGEACLSVSVGTSPRPAARRRPTVVSTASPAIGPRPLRVCKPAQEANMAALDAKTKQELQDIAHKLRVHSINMTTASKSG